MQADPLTTAEAEFLARFEPIPAVQALRQRVEAGGVFSCVAVAPAAQAFVVALLARWFPRRRVVAVTPGLKAQEAFHQDLTTWQSALAGTPIVPASGGAPVPAPAPASEPASLPPLFYPAWEVLPHEGRLPHADVISERLETLVALGDPAVAAPVRPVVTTAVALMQRTLPPAYLAVHLRRLRQGETVGLLDLIEWLEAQAYESEAQVTQKGELALRGGILDLWPLTSPWPVRLEFFGDTLESLRLFDPTSQMSRAPLEDIVLPPAGELGLLRRLLGPATPRASGDGVAASVPGAGLGLAPEPAVAPGLDPAAAATLLDYLPADAVCVGCEPDLLDAAADLYRGQVPSDDPFIVAWTDVQAQLRRGGRTFIALQETGPSLAPDSSVSSTGWSVPLEALADSPGGPDLESPAAAPGPGAGAGAGVLSPDAKPEDCVLALSDLEAFRPLAERAPELQVAETQRRAFFDQLHRWLRQGYAVHVFCNNDGERQRFTEIWEEGGYAATDPASPAPRARLGSLSRGFLFDAARLVVVTDAEVFGRYKVQRPRRLKSPHAVASRSIQDIDFTELEFGDYVVHVQHGIGRYLGLQALPQAPARRGAAAPPASQDAAGSDAQECLVIEYAPRESGQPAPKLYVPIAEAHLVSKYVGAGRARPPLNTLGGTRWGKAMAQTQAAVRDLAGELLELQAARASQPGVAAPPDLPWQREFEASFLYEETPDQVRAIEAVKRDLEAARPMDRLICGDVGFGKTEVAIRAAFKMVLSGRQVAVLVPTTVLAQQHFNTFRERMADYPVRIELLSRFRTRGAQQRVARDLASGAVDLVVGTHRLLQSDIRFKDLGLVVIDEEQRFGVLQKERFKRLRTLVDVLTLSATPIPRTLYLALTGTRDMSTIETPPQDRLPVETIVTPYDERIVRDAIQRELNRGGQAFFLHNRVQTIEAVAVRLKTLVPAARLVVGHGQMHADDLEEVMTAFVNGEADVLLCTTIIESGIDIPNANTILIDRADRFGLSELYQLRGRVGRYKHQAYAYLLLPRHAGLLTDARKRIGAIKQYSTLGSGFKIALRDLEIRGAGNLLGPEQSGHINAVGFELYCQLLKQSVASLKGEPVRPRIEVVVHLDFLALHPGDEARPGAPGTSRATRPRTAAPTIEVPREVTTWVPDDRVAEDDEDDRASGPTIPKAPAYLPANYIREPQPRIEMYRKLAEIADRGGLERLRAEMRDRFGPLPAAVELLLELSALKLLAASRGVTAMACEGDKLKLTRHGDFVLAGTRFPRLTGRDARARFQEIRRLLTAL